MLQAPVGQGLSLDPFAFGQDGLAAAEVDVGWGEIVQALVGAAVVVVLDEAAHLLLQGTRQIVVLEQDAVLQGLVPALDLALGLRMARRASDVGHTVVLEPVGQVTGDVAGAVVAQEPRAVPGFDLV